MGFIGIQIDQEEGWTPVVNKIEEELSSIKVRRKTKETEIELKIINNKRGDFLGDIGLPF